MDALMETTGFGQRLRALRTDRGLTLARVAEQTGIHLQSLSRLERGERDPSWKTVLKLAEALGVTPDAFLATEERPTQQPPKGKRKKD